MHVEERERCQFQQSDGSRTRGGNRRWNHCSRSESTSRDRQRWGERGRGGVRGGKEGRAFVMCRREDCFFNAGKGQDSCMREPKKNQGIWRDIFSLTGTLPIGARSYHNLRKWRRSGETHRDDIGVTPGNFTELTPSLSHRQGREESFSQDRGITRETEKASSIKETARKKRGLRFIEIGVRKKRTEKGQSLYPENLFDPRLKKEEEDIKNRAS